MLTFSKYGVHCGTKNFSVGSLDCFLISILWVGWVVRDIVTLGLELSNALHELGDRGRDVGELDDVALGGLGKLTKSCKLIRNSLFRG